MPLSKEMIAEIERVQKGNQEVLAWVRAQPSNTHRDFERLEKWMRRALREQREEGRAEGRRERFW